MLDILKVLESPQIEDIKKILSEPENLSKKDSGNNTLLHYACMMGKHEVVDMIIKLGFNANVGNIEGLTPICDAALNGSFDIVKLLIDQGVDVNPPSYWGNPLLCATEQGNCNIMKILIDAGAYLNAPGRSGRGPIHEAIIRKHYDCLDILLMAGANSNLRVNLETPLHMAVKADDIEAARRLLRHGANPSLRDTFGRTPSDYLCSESQITPLLQSYMDSVSKLQFLVRLRFRQLLPSCEMRHVSKLQLPVSMCNYLTFMTD